MLSFLNVSEEPLTRFHFSLDDAAVIIEATEGQVPEVRPEKTIADIYLDRVEVRTLHAWLGAVLVELDKQG
jgi:hypothetical protein